MFFEKKNNSQSIARQIIKQSGLKENLKILEEKHHLVPQPPKDILRLILALSTCNLVQTMKTDFISQKLPQETRDDITRDYVLESFKNQDLAKLKGNEEIEALRQGVMEVVVELQKFWSPSEDPQDSGPGPRYYCVKEILARLGGETNYEVHDALFELMYIQYRHYLDYFRETLGETGK